MVFEFRDITSNGLDVKIVFSNVLLDFLSKLIDVVDSFLFLCGEECVSSGCGTRERINKNGESVCSLLRSSSVSVATRQFVPRLKVTKLFLKLRLILRLLNMLLLLIDVEKGSVRIKSLVQWMMVHE